MPLEISTEYLKESDPALYESLKPYIHADGTVDDVLPAAHMTLLRQWVMAHHEVIEKVQPAPFKDTHADDMKRINEENQARRQREADEQQAIAYLQGLVNKESLADCPENRDLIVNYLNECNLPASLKSAQQAVAALKDKLIWIREAVEVFGTLPNGEPQLSINASESEMKRASVAQLRDLSARRAEGRVRVLQAGTAVAFKFPGAILCAGSGPLQGIALGRDSGEWTPAFVLPLDASES